ncbi:MAG TPA: hypothetical protein VM120_26570 [Bryobacteraceae bacterium]|nr:hypothetical protein [Bryobacteraceae bacterium]
MPLLLFTGGTALLAAVIFGLAPAWNAFASGPALSLRARGRRRRLGNSLVVAQVALSVVLLSGAGMFAGRLSTLRNADLGFRRDRVLLVTLILRAARSEQLAGLYQDLLGRLEAIPGVLPATLCAVTPITGAGASRFATVEGREEKAASRLWDAPDGRARLLAVYAENSRRPGGSGG